MAKKAIIPPTSGSSVVNITNTERVLSAACGALLVTLGVKNMRKHRAVSLAGTLAGTYLMFRGASGYCPVNAAMGRNSTMKQPASLTIVEYLTINRQREVVYAFWRKLENLPRFMHHIHKVTELDEQHSHWEARIPGLMTSIKWGAEITKEVEGKKLAWRSVKGAAVDNAGEIIFKNAPGGHGTLIQATIYYRPPAGDVGKVIARMLTKSFEKMIRGDLQRFKEVIERGES